MTRMEYENGMMPIAEGKRVFSQIPTLSADLPDEIYLFRQKENTGAQTYESTSLFS